jgi:outer membrane protein
MNKSLNFILLGQFGINNKAITSIIFIFVGYRNLIYLISMIRSLIFTLFILIGSSSQLGAQERVWSLEQCILYAVENNIQVKQQEIQTKFQENYLLQSKIGILPSLNGQASNNFSFGRALDETTYQYTENSNVVSSSFYAGTSVTLFNGLQQLNTIKRNQFNLEASIKDLDAMRESIALNVALSYLQILLNKELVTVTENQLNITREQIEKTRKMVDAGSLAKGNLLDIEAQAAREEVQLINNQNTLNISILTLTQMLEFETAEGFDIIVPDYSVNEDLVVDDSPYDLFLESENIRPEIESARLRLKSAEQDLLIARGARSPRLSLSTSFSTGYSDIRRKILTIDPILGPEYGPYPFGEQLNDNINYGIGLSLNIPIFNGWQVNTAINNSRLGIESSRYSLEASRKQLYKNIQQSFADAEGSLKAYHSSTKAVGAMSESFRYTEQKFNVGMVTPVEYNTSKTELLNAQSELAQSKYQFLFRTKVLDFYRGIPLTLEN